LGESRNTVERFNTPLGQATTDSLEALNAYRVGYDLRNRGHGHEAIPYFKAAIMLDPKFAMAYQELGSVYSNIGEEKTGSGFVQKAFDLRERTTEPERYFISGRYFDVVTGEIQKALSIYSLWHSTYPHEWTPLNAYANDLNLLGQYPLAAQTAQEAMERDPNHAFGYSNLALSLMGANRFTEAEQVCREALARNRTSTILERVRFQLAFMTGDTNQIRAAAAGMKDDLDKPYWQAEAMVSQGKLKQAEKLFADSVALAHGAGLPGIESADLAGEALSLALIGETNKARPLARLSISDEAGEAGYGEPMTVLALLGDSVEVANLRWKMDRVYPVSEYNLDVYRPMAEGLLARRRGADAAQILEVMAPAVPYELGQYAALLPVYLRAILLADAGDAEAARREFQHVLDNRGVDPTSPMLPLAHLGLARAHHSLQQTAESCTEYEEFFREWKDGDPQVPVLRAARHEAAGFCSPSH
jgi:eukaryotic-like serine/threonine-protein kinase